MYLQFACALTDSLSVSDSSLFKSGNTEEEVAAILQEPVTIVLLVLHGRCPFHSAIPDFLNHWYQS